MNDHKPLITVLTPVYNGEQHIAECIESVIRQTYQNWEYIIVNNCSTDRTSEIITAYAGKDPRVRVIHNSQFVDAIENHNIAFQQVTPISKYCRLVQADDWLFPESIARMVELAESLTSVGVVGSYCLAGTRVVSDGVDYDTSLIPGAELCRKTLLGKIYLFWRPSCLLLRSDLVRNRQPFYKIQGFYTDLDAMYDILQSCDFGFVHQVLTYIRRHGESRTQREAKQTDQQLLSKLKMHLKYGSVYLGEDEYNKRHDELLTIYYQSLARAVFERRGRKFWQYQKAELQKLGYPFNRTALLGRLITAIMFRPRDVARRIKHSFATKT